MMIGEKVKVKDNKAIPNIPLNRKGRIIGRDCVCDYLVKFLTPVKLHTEDGDDRVTDVMPFYKHELEVTK